MRKLLLIFLITSAVLWGQSACDLNEDGATNIIDYQLLVNMALGKIPCTANINGAGVCDVVTAQRIINAGFGKGCVVDEVPPSLPHSVTLSWTHSTSPNVTSYKIYRGIVSGGPYVLLVTIGYVNTYLDESVIAGATYYYVATAVDSGGNESAYSNQAQAVIPSP